MARFDQDGAPLPGVSPVAMQEARNVAENIARDLAHVTREPFHYRDKGSMATIGRSRAVAQTGRMHLSGFLAWLAWLTVHIWYLIGFRSRLVVLLTWAWMYVTYRRGARIITSKTWRPHSSAPLPAVVVKEKETEKETDGKGRPREPQVHESTSAT
jgi:NADH dehydrogenase